MAGIPFFLEPRPFTVLSATSGPANRPASHLAEFDYAGMLWESDATTFHQVDIDFGAAVAIDHASLLSTNAQAGTEIIVTAGPSSADAGGATPTWTSGWQTLISPAVTGRDRYNGFVSFTAQTYRYWSVRIRNHSGVFSASILAMGQRITPTRYYETEWEAGPEDLSNFARGRNGVPEVARGVNLNRLGFTMAWMTEAEHEQTFAPLMRRLGRTNPCLLCFDPDATVYRQGRTYFGTMADVGRPRKVGFNRFEKRFEIASII